jgi:hypothetical protein
MGGCAKFIVIGAGLVIAFIAYCLISGPAKVTAEDYRTGVRCLGGFDGSLPAFRDAVKNSLRDPDSFDLVDTTITPLNAAKTHTVSMTYRARNGFGGLNVETDRARVSADCTILERLD